MQVEAPHITRMSIVGSECRQTETYRVGYTYNITYHTDKIRETLGMISCLGIALAPPPMARFNCLVCSA